jgi:hypothetical protein
MGKKTVADLEEIIVSMSASLDGITSKLSNMEDLLNASLEENKQLKAELAEKNKTIGDMACKLNLLEMGLNKADQYQRSWSVRVANIPLTAEEEKDPAAVKKKVYDLALRPILVGAQVKGLISSVPDADGLLEVAHILPAKTGTAKPIITRFYNRNLRSICLRLRKEFAPRMGGSGRGGGTESGRAGAGGASGAARSEDPEGRGRYSFPVFEDLTRANFLKMRELALHDKVQSCWSINGQLRFKLNNSPNVYRVKSVFESADQIIQQL